MIYLQTTPEDEKPCYLPEIGGYFMSKSEQSAIYLNLKARRTSVKNEIAGLEVDLKEAGVLFSALSRSLTACHAANLDWGRYQNLASELPAKAKRYEWLKAELENIQAQLDKFSGLD